MQRILAATLGFGLIASATADDAIKPIPKSTELTRVPIDHADASWNNDGGFICVFFVDIGAKRVRIEVNATKSQGCPQQIYIGDRP